MRSKAISVTEPCTDQIQVKCWSEDTGVARTILKGIDFPGLFRNGFLRRLTLSLRIIVHSSSKAIPLWASFSLPRTDAQKPLIR